MEKFSGLLYSSYQFSDKFSELPDFLLKEINKALQVDLQAEGFVAACWIENILMKGKVFILVTGKRVAYSDTIRVNQNLFADMTGVERNLLKNIKLLSPGNATILFPSNVTPVPKLMDKMFDVINAQWIKSRQQASAPVPQAAPNIMEQIEQLNALKEKGILTAEEFTQKKTELLAKI